MPGRSAPHGSVSAPSRLLGQVVRALLSASLLPVAGCSDPDPAVFTKLFTTDHFVYYLEEGVTPPCDETGEWLERYYSANAKFLGATLAPGERVEYYFAPGEVSRQCPPGAAACARGKTIYSPSPVEAHEIVHANASLVGSAPSLFAEGLAVILSCQTTGDSAGPLDISEPIESLVETAAWMARREAHGSVYTPSASFVRYLMDRFGSARFLSFYARAPWDGVRPVIDAVFQAEMGVSLDDAFSDWRTKSPPYFGDWCLRLMECDPTMPALANTEVVLGCGPWAALPVVQDAVLRFEVPEDRIVRLTTEPVPAEPQPFPSVAFYRCSGGDVVGAFNMTSGAAPGADHALHIDPGWPGEAFALDVPPGDYVAWFQSSAKGAEARIHVDVADQLSPMRNTACQGAEQPLALDDKHPTVLASRWIERPCQGPWCPGQGWDVSIGPTGGALMARVGGDANLSPGTLYICSEPCPEDASLCEVLDLDPAKPQPARSKQTFQPGTVVHLGAPAAPFADHFAVQLRLAPE